MVLRMLLPRSLRITPLSEKIILLTDFYKFLEIFVDQKSSKLDVIKKYSNQCIAVVIDDHCIKFHGFMVFRSFKIRRDLLQQSLEMKGIEEPKA